MLLLATVTTNKRKRRRRRPWLLAVASINRRFEEKPDTISARKEGDKQAQRTNYIC